MATKKKEKKIVDITKEDTNTKEKYGKDKHIWENNVEVYILLKSNEEYFTDSVCKHGYFRGIETYNFVRDITQRFERYKEIIK